MIIALFDSQVMTATYVLSGRNQPDDVKMKLIDMRVPEQSFKFPGRQYNDSKRKRGTYTRYCNREWLNEFKFLLYSKAQDGLYCLSCILFPSTSQAHRAESLICTPYQNWKKSTSRHSQPLNTQVPFAVRMQEASIS